MYEERRYGERLNICETPAFNHVGGIQNNSHLNVLVFGSRWVSLAGPNDFIEFFSGIILHENTYYIDFSLLVQSWVLTKEVCEAIPPQITTLEVSLRLEEDLEGIVTLGLPSDLKYVQNLSRLIINYPAHISRLECFEQILNDLHKLTESLPHLRQVYLKTNLTANRHIKISEHEASHTKKEILKHLSVKVEECRFYNGRCFDTLVATYKAPLKINTLYSFFDFFTLKKRMPLEILAEVLLYADAVRTPKKIWGVLEQTAKDSYLAKHYPCESGRLLKEHGLFNHHFQACLQDNRHKNAEEQHEYDKRFGLVSLTTACRQA